MTYDTDERSADASRPIDLYKMAAPSGTYYVTSHTVNVGFGGFTYVATTMSRGNQQVAQDLTGREMVVHLPITHPIVQSFASQGIPERELLVTQLRLQERSGIAIQGWSGFANGITIDGHTAILRIPSITDDSMKVRLPIVAAQTLCNHVLFNDGCAPNPGGGDGPSRATFSVATTIVAQTSAQTGPQVTVASMGGNPNDWATYGEIVSNITGERRLVLSQTSTSLLINVRFIGAPNGSPVTVYAGCALDRGACRDKFANLPNHGGMLYMNSALNYWTPDTGLSVVVQS